ncbi:hypothetical protein BCR35DRAFT_294449 [Leucosporidium creatinivorum]|uniref:Proteophosphoglycan ppg4 n=1 Tax=Leucosporidium creatinivorum TaxID=106004 RepID=A0A1Y2EGA7_9BASI|nr:hypothetical protein BCR35DRAFT_294449 [Leucosporidium creatinivorum]
MPATERSPLLPTSKPSTSTSSPTPSLRARVGMTAGGGGGGQQASASASAAAHFYTEDDIAIEGMVLVLLQELEERGYTVPAGLVDPPVDMPLEEAEAEQAVLKTVFAVPRHRLVFNEYLPYLERATVLPNGAAEAGVSGAAGGRVAGVGGAVGGSAGASTSTTPYSSTRPSPLSSQVLDSTVLTSPSALLLASLLSLLISLQTEVTAQVQETDRGVDGELRMFKARRELGERLYAVVGGLLDSYLLSGDQKDEEGEDALVTLLFHDFALNYDSIDRATCSLDLLLNLSSYPLVEAEDLVSHPVVLASTEYVWRNGLLPAPKEGEDTSLSWTDSVVRLDRFSIPRILHMQTYILSTLHAFVTVYILMFSAYAHLYTLNPLAPEVPRPPGIPERGKPEHTWSVVTSLVWWLWVAGTFGWFGEVLRAWHHRGPHPSLPLSPSTLLPLIHYALVLASLALRLCLLFFRRPPTFILASSLSILAWSVPFLAASRVLPQNLPAFGAPTHLRWEKIRDGRKRRELGYRPPPKSVPVSHRALRSLEANLGGLVQFGTYFAVFGVLLLWSLSGELDYPGVFLSPLLVRTAVLNFLAPSSSFTTTTSTPRTVSPLEARTTLAFTLILGLVLAYFSGGRPSVSGKSATKPRKELDDLDGWDRYGREVAFRARRERLAINRYYSYVPPPASDARQRALESVPGAFGTPPLPSPLNLAVLPVRIAAFVCKQSGREEYAKVVQERGLLWAWRAGIAPLGVWALTAKAVRTLRHRE